MESIEPVLSGEPTSGVHNDSTIAGIPNANNPGEVRKIKVDGEWVEVPLSKLEESYGLEKSSRKRFEDASTLRKQVDTFLGALQRGELDNLSEVVPEDKLYDFAEKLLRKKIEWEESPEDKKAKILAERRAEAAEKQLEDYNKKEQEKIVNYTNQKAAEEIDDEISSVINELEKTHGKMVKSPEFIQDIARVMLAQLEKGAGSMSAKTAADLAYKTWRKRIGSYVNNIGHDDLRTFLSKDQIESLRKYDLDNALSQFPKSSSKKGDDKLNSSKKSTFKDVNDYFAKLEQKFG